MHLRWEDQSGIARALVEAYPEADRLTISSSSDAFLCMIRALPSFDDDAPPPPRALDHILWTWMRLADTLPGKEC